MLSLSDSEERSAVKEDAFFPSRAIRDHVSASAFPSRRSLREKNDPF